MSMQEQQATQWLIQQRLGDRLWEDLKQRATADPIWNILIEVGSLQPTYQGQPPPWSELVAKAALLIVRQNPNPYQITQKVMADSSLPFLLANLIVKKQIIAQLPPNAQQYYFQLDQQYKALIGANTQPKQNVIPGYGQATTWNPSMHHQSPQMGHSPAGTFQQSPFQAAGPQSSGGGMWDDTTTATPTQPTTDRTFTPTPYVEEPEPEPVDEPVYIAPRLLGSQIENLGMRYLSEGTVLKTFNPVLNHYRFILDTDTQTYYAELQRGGNIVDEASLLRIPQALANSKKLQTTVDNGDTIGIEDAVFETLETAEDDYGIIPKTIEDTEVATTPVSELMLLAKIADSRGKDIAFTEILKEPYTWFVDKPIANLLKEFANLPTKETFFTVVIAYCKDVKKKLPEDLADFLDERIRHAIYLHLDGGMGHLLADINNFSVDLDEMIEIYEFLKSKYPERLKTFEEGSSNVVKGIFSVMDFPYAEVETIIGCTKDDVIDVDDNILYYVQIENVLVLSLPMASLNIDWYGDWPQLDKDTYPKLYAMLDDHYNDTPGVSNTVYFSDGVRWTLSKSRMKSSKGTLIINRYI